MDRSRLQLLNSLLHIDYLLKYKINKLCAHQFFMLETNMSAILHDQQMKLSYKRNSTKNLSKWAHARLLIFKTTSLALDKLRFVENFVCICQKTFVEKLVLTISLSQQTILANTKFMENHIFYFCWLIKIIMTKNCKRSCWW